MPSSAKPHPLILLVEDSDDTREMCSAWLRAEGYRTAGAEDGRVGLEMALAERPALVLMDIGLPDLDGREVTRRLKADPRTAGVPVVVLSGTAADEAQSERGSLWEAYLSKPCRPEELIACVKSILYEVR
jgi:CheY-like chemotaxis protein